MQFGYEDIKFKSWSYRNYPRYTKKDYLRIFAKARIKPKKYRGISKNTRRKNAKKRAVYSARISVINYQPCNYASGVLRLLSRGRRFWLVRRSEL